MLKVAASAGCKPAIPADRKSALHEDQFWKGCKPNFVCASCEAERIICLSSQYPRLDLSAVEQAVPESPIWPCSRWGFPCLRDYSWSGGLLLHLFTLALSRLLGTVAVYFLWHCPSVPIYRDRPRVSHLKNELRGIAPFGVRTFLPELAPEAILHPSKTEQGRY